MSSRASRQRPRRIGPRAGIAAGTLALAATGLAVTAPSAFAAPVGAYAELADALDDCAGTTAAPTEVELSDDITATTDRLAVAAGCVAELDLNGNDLHLDGIDLGAGSTLTLLATGGGTLDAVAGTAGDPGIRTTDATLQIVAGAVTATGAEGGAGIGGGSEGDGGALIIDGSNVDAAGGMDGAGIGGGLEGAGGFITMNDGVVAATGGRFAAGIGGGGDNEAFTVIINGGTVDATGGEGGSGVGGGYMVLLAGVGGTVAIHGGNVTATGGDDGAGIGGGAFGNLAAATITAGVVTANGGDGGAGIGGGGEPRGDGRSSGGVVTITGGEVRAIGGTMAAGIGGGHAGFDGTQNEPLGGDGGALSVGPGAVVTATGGHSAVGTGDGGFSFGSLLVEGTLRLPSGDLVIPDLEPGTEVVTESTGLIESGPDGPGAQCAGTGQVDNGGAITLPTANVTGNGSQVEILDHHYRVTFDPQGGTLAAGTTNPVTVFAESFDAGERPFPADPTPPAGETFLGWNSSADGSGVELTADSTLPGASPGCDPVDITAFAQFTGTTSTAAVDRCGGNGGGGGDNDGDGNDGGDGGGGNGGGGGSNNGGGDEGQVDDQARHLPDTGAPPIGALAGLALAAIVAGALLRVARRRA